MAEMGIYRVNLSAIIYNRFVIAQNSFDLSITDIAFVTHFAIADKLSRQMIVSSPCSKLVSWHYKKNTRCP